MKQYESRIITKGKKIAMQFSGAVNGMKARIKIFCGGILIAGTLLSACSGAPMGSGNTTYAVAPSLREFYQSVGGEALLGPAISKDFSKDNYQCQYTSNALMCYNPLVTDNSRFFLYPLGDQMGISDDPTEATAETGSQSVDGFAIYDEFLPYFNQLSGEKYTGKPLTQARMNYQQKRIEQFFENVGFYKKFSDPSGTVHLMAYGAYACQSDCDFTPAVDAAVSLTANSSASQPLLAGLSKMGNTAVLGTPLTQPYIAADGMEEQVYSNAVVYAPPSQPGNAKLRPLARLLNLPTSTPGPQVYDSSQGVVFYPTDGKNGFHVPLDFDKFIADHGGKDYSGNPIMEVTQYDATTFRQCFENYCLDYHSDLPQGQNVQMAPLGSQYLQQAGGSESSPAQPVVLDASQVSLQSGTAYQEIPANGEQKFDILVLNQENGQPLANLTAELQVTLPNQSPLSADFPATGVDGRATLVLPAQKDLSNGQIITYQVCIHDGVSSPVCSNGSYVIWGN